MKKISAKNYRTNDLYLGYIENSQNSTVKKQFNKQMGERHEKTCSWPLAVREMQNKSTMRYNCTLIITTKIFFKKTENTACWKDAELYH